MLPHARLTPAAVLFRNFLREDDIGILLNLLRWRRDVSGLWNGNH
jgi:hypothetical protein